VGHFCWIASTEVTDLDDAEISNPSTAGAKSGL
jgi:hypothetical protein